MDVLDININSNIQARPQYKIILTPWSLTLPIDLEQYNFKHVEFEIGFGNGEFTVQNAEAHPDTLFFGLDVSASCVLRCARRAAGLQNLKIIRTDARYMMKELFRDNSLDVVRMNFPCPWPKRKQAHRRVTARSFTDDLATVLKPDGVFEMVTDDEDYAREVHEKLGAHPMLKTLDFEINPHRPVTTKYERKWLAMGKKIYRLTFAKKQDAQNFTVQRHTWSGINQEGSMHFKTATPPEVERISALNGIKGTSKDDLAHWAFGRCCKELDPSSSEAAFLLETYSSDDEFEQRYYIRISERDGGSLVQLDKTANAFLTPAVRASLADAAERLK